MSSAFKAIGKFLFGGGQTQPAAPPAQPAPGPEPNRNPQHQQAYGPADVPFLGRCCSCGWRCCWWQDLARELTHGYRCTFCQSPGSAPAYAR